MTVKHSPYTLFQAALESHRRGNLDDAERLYRLGLSIDPHDFTGLHSLGVLRAQQGRNNEAADLIGRAIRVRPDVADAWMNHGDVLSGAGRFAQALRSYDGALGLAPGNLRALEGRARTLFSMERFDEALAVYDALLSAAPANVAALNDRGNILWRSGRLHEALASFDDALGAEPGNLEALNNRGNILRHMRRFDEALACYDAVLSVEPKLAEVLSNRGVTLSELQRSAEALISYDEALEIDPALTEAWNNRGFSLRELGDLAAALESYEQALRIDPGHVAALNNRGKLLCEMGDIAGAFESFSTAAQLTAQAGDADLDAVLRRRIEAHDREQRRYLAGQGEDDARHRRSDGARLSEPAVNRETIEAAVRDWGRANPRFIVVDDFLTPAALQGLRRFCWRARIWRRPYEGGYIGAFPESGLACPLLAQVAEELRDAYPDIVGAHALRYVWAFKHGGAGVGTHVHADEAAVNMNFWITPDDANLDPTTGGLVVWDTPAPRTWDFSRFNDDAASAHAFLESAGATRRSVPYRANRAVIFDSNLFHATDAFSFKPGYSNERINITMLFGRRQDAESWRNPPRE